MKTNLSYDQYIPTRILFGSGQLNNLHAQPMPGKRALIVISNGKSTRDNGYLARTEEQLHRAGVETEVFDGIMPNPTVANSVAGANAARAYNADFLVALGGGSVMDCSKAIALLATNEGDLWDYVAIGSGKGQPIQNRLLPIIAITTTAGTGSETDGCGVITKEETNEKAFIMHPSLFPALAIVDPELMLSVPPRFTAFQGFDALFHSVEGFIAASANLASDMKRTRGNPQPRPIPAACREGRFRFGSPYPCCIRQHPVWSRNDAHAVDQRTRAGTRAFRLSSQSAARSRIDYDQQGIFQLFRPQSRLRRAFRRIGSVTRYARCNTARRFHYGTRPLAGSLRGGGPENVRLWYHAR